MSSVCKYKDPCFFEEINHLLNQGNGLLSTAKKMNCSKDTIKKSLQYFGTSLDNYMFSKKQIVLANRCDVDPNEKILSHDFIVRLLKTESLASISNQTLLSEGFLRYYLLKYNKINSKKNVELWKCTLHGQIYMAVYEYSDRTRCYCIGCNGKDSTQKRRHQNKQKAIEQKAENAKIAAIVILFFL